MKQSNINKAKTDLNNRLIEAIENNEEISFELIVGVSKTLTERYNLTENKDFNLFINHSLSKLSLCKNFKDYFFTFTLYLYMIELSHDDKVMAELIKFFFDGKLTISNLIDFANDDKAFYHNNKGFKKALQYVSKF